MNILLWILHALAALMYGASGVMKVFLFDEIRTDVPSFAALPRPAWMALGILELVCTLDLIIPGALHWQPSLTLVVASALAIESLVFVWVHVKYREATPIIMSGALGLLMAFIVYGRMLLKPISWMAARRSKFLCSPLKQVTEIVAFRELRFCKADHGCGWSVMSCQLCYTRRMRAILSCLFLILFCGSKTLPAKVDPSWTTPIPPFRIADNLYYVGSQDLASYLVVTPQGNILINPNLGTSPSQIRTSIEQLGFHWSDTKILLNSQAHFDHMAGAAQVIRETHAKNMVMDGDVKVVETGGGADFLSPSPNIPGYAPAHVDRVLHDEDTVTLGGVTLTAHKTAGHTRGCTTWTMRSHLPGEPPGTLRNIVIVGGTSFWSEYHFAAAPGHPVSYPGIVQDFQHTFTALRALPCDVFLGAHGGYFDMRAKLKRYPKDGPRVFIDPAAYKSFVADAQQTFEKTLSKQQAAVAH
jgi:metallo-beta-lactamase class B